MSLRIHLVSRMLSSVVDLHDLGLAALAHRHEENHCPNVTVTISLFMFNA